MSIEMVPLTSCQFCGKGAGAILLDRRALNEVRKSHEDGNWQDETDHNLVIRFNSPQRQPGPCPHLINLNVDICWGVKIDPSDWATTVDWLNPIVNELDPNEDVRDLWLDLARHIEHEEFLPKQRHQFEKLDDLWPDLGSNSDAERFYETYGIAVFAKDIPAFFAELFEKEEQRKSARQAGRETKVEWYKTKVNLDRALQLAAARATGGNQC